MFDFDSIVPALEAASVLLREFMRPCREKLMCVAHTNETAVATEPHALFHCGRGFRRRSREKEQLFTTRQSLCPFELTKSELATRKQYKKKKVTLTSRIASTVEVKNARSLEILTRWKGAI